MWGKYCSHMEHMGLLKVTFVTIVNHHEYIIWDASPPKLTVIGRSITFRLGDPELNLHLSLV